MNSNLTPTLIQIFNMRLSIQTLRRYLFLIVVFILCVESAFTQQAPCIPVRDIPESVRSFDSGEKLTYVLGYTWGVIDTDVAQATLSLDKRSDDTGTWFYAKLLGNTYKFFDMFFKVRYDFEAKFSTTNGKPVYFSRDIIEGKYTKKNYLHFHPDNSILSTVQRRSNPPRDTLLMGRECTFDLLSLIYFSRNIDLTDIVPGTVVPISFVIDGMIYDIYFRYIGSEVKKIQRVGQFNTLKFGIKVVVGDVFKDTEELMLWITNDKNRIPIFFESPISVGKVSGRISKYENLKHPLVSKIK